jgi:hypothetical protein
MLSASSDPTVVAFNAPAGSLYLRTNGVLYVKQDAGLTTNWVPLQSGQIDLTSDVTGVLPLANGGTNKNMTAVGGGIVWTDADSMEVISAGTSGQVLQSNGAAAPSWITLSGGGITTLNTLTAATQTFAFGSTGLTPNVVSNTSTHTFHFPLASGAGVTSGTITKTEYDAFNAKVDGPASSVDGEIALFDSTTGKLIKRATGTGFVRATSGVYSTAASVDLTSDVTGVLPLANGGTNKNMTAVNGGVVWTDADSMEVISAGTAGQVLQSNGAAAPSWTTVLSSPSITTNTVNFTAACNSINFTTNAISVQLPSPVSGCTITVKKKDASTVTVVRAAAEQIEGVAASWSMADTKESNTFVSDGTDWFII